MHSMFIHYCTSWDGKLSCNCNLLYRSFIFLIKDIFLPLTNIVLLFFVKREVAVCVKL